jgi:diguanylate cyclase (GGDEF)-like protein/PAS domain S-box-containing protein
MEFQFPAINYLYLLACILALVLRVISHNYDGDRSNRYWNAVLLSFVIWTLGELLANIGTTLQWQLAFQRLVYLGVVSGVVSWLFFAIHFSGNQRWLTPLSVTVMLIVPAASLMLVGTVEWHQLFYADAQLIFRDGYYVLDFDYGIAFWVQIIFCSYLYTCAGSTLLIATSLRQSSLYRSQSMLIVVAAAIPLIVNVLYVLGLDFAGGFDPTSLFFVFSAILITIATRHYYFLRVAPMARDLVFRNINSGVVVVNQAQRVTDINPAFAQIAKLNSDELIGMPFEQLLNSTFDTQCLHRSEHAYSGRVMARHQARQFEIDTMPIKGYHGELLGQLYLLTDVTQIQRALEEIRRLAHTDLLTQLPNRRAMIEWVDNLASIDTMFKPVLIAMADLDHFKVLNDTYGHHCGDFILTEVARIIQSELGSGDIIARWGGEEFCMVLTGRDLTGGESFLEKLRQSIEDHLFKYEEQELRVTITFGMVQRLAGEELELAIRRADMMMYDGKRRGRNLVSSRSERDSSQ